MNSDTELSPFPAPKPKVKKVVPYPRCPKLSWIIAKRVCNKREDQDAFIVLSGRKGAGKSTASLSLAEAIAEDISKRRFKSKLDKEQRSPSDFFNIDHVVSVTKEGAVRLLTSGILLKENSVVLLDDVSLQWNSRNFQTWINKALNDILTIARIYKCVIIANCVQTSHIDKIARELTDYRIVMMRKSTVTKQALFRCYYFELGPDGAEYRHFLTWHGHRIKTWVIGLPSKKIMKEYKSMRTVNTTEYMELTSEKVSQKLDGKKKKDGRIKDAEHPDIADNIDYVAMAHERGDSVNAIMAARGISRTVVNRCVALYKEKQNAQS